MSASSSHSALRRAGVVRAAVPTGGVLSRAILAELGCDRHVVAREVAAGRWLTHVRQTVAVHTGSLDELARRWRAIWEVGRRIAVLDGVTALQASGLTGFHEYAVHVSVPHTATIRSVDGVVIHKVPRRDPSDVLVNGIPRARPGAAAIRAAQWARSDRQAALLLALPVQQRLVSGPDLVASASRVRGRARRALIPVLVADIAHGAQSLGELDFAHRCRRWGIPEPTRQAVRRLPGGVAYLDVWWREQRLAVEIDGSGHRMGLAVTADNLRQNELVLGADRVLRLDLLGLRLEEAAFMNQIRRGLGLSGRRSA
ncbi:MAG: hypothetical protein WBP39_00055 [Candidatus Phosphoribacter baldrii]